MKKICVLLLFVLTGLGLHAQGNFGFGGGLDYGGFGVRTVVMPAKQLGLFLGLGYNLSSLGYNFGVQYKFPSSTRTVGYLTGMYGYNGVLVVSGSISKSTVYFGPSIGAGLELTSKRREKNFWNLEILLPFRDAQFQKDIDALKALGATVSTPLPVAFSFGYHIKF